MARVWCRLKAANDCARIIGCLSLIIRPLPEPAPSISGARTSSPLRPTLRRSSTRMPAFASSDCASRRLERADTPGRHQSRSAALENIIVERRRPMGPRKPRVRRRQRRLSTSPSRAITGCSRTSTFASTTCASRRVRRRSSTATPTTLLRSSCPVARRDPATRRALGGGGKIRAWRGEVQRRFKEAVCAPCAQ